MNEKYINRKKFIEGKREANLIAYSEKLNKLVSSFYMSLSSSNESNQENFDILNKEWKTICAKARRFNKITLPINAFEKTIVRNRIISKVYELEPRFSGDYLNTLSDQVLSEILEDRNKRGFYLSRYEANQQIENTKNISVQI